MLEIPVSGKICMWAKPAYKSEDDNEKCNGCISNGHKTLITLKSSIVLSQSSRIQEVKFFLVVPFSMRVSLTQILPLTEIAMGRGNENSQGWGILA